MKRNYADPELKVTRFEYEAIMDVVIGGGDTGIEDTPVEFSQTDGGDGGDSWG